MTITYQNLWDKAKAVMRGKLIVKKKKKKPTPQNKQTKKTEGGEWWHMPQSQHLEAEAGGWWVWGQPELHSKTLSQKQKQQQ
jgi:hypothetical protein